MARLTKRTSNHSKLDAIRNPDGIWINTSVFREEAIHFKKNGYYTPEPWGTPGWRDYWDEQLNRCINGYSVGGARITGHHYGYLNFAQIQMLDEESLKAGKKSGKKVTAFPAFWDGDYNYFHCVDIARNGCTPEQLKQLQLSVQIKDEHLGGGYHMLVGKARRKGYSFKNGFMCANNYNTIRGSLSLIGAFDKAYLYGKGKGTMVMASSYLNFLNEHTGWRKSRDYADKMEHKKASFKKIVGGVGVESGYMSEILAITYKDNPDAGRGKDAYLALLEEAGAWPGLKQAWGAMRQNNEDGEFMTGMMIAFGTSGDMEPDGGTVDFAEMFWEPELYGCMPFVNIWDEDAEDTQCNFFHPMQWNRVGAMDEQGNSDIQGVLAKEREIREKIVNKSAGTGVLLSRMQELPTCPSEAFQTIGADVFPTVELRNRLNLVLREQLHIKNGQPVELYRDADTGKIIARPDLTGKLQPIWTRTAKSDDKKGCVVIYEHPVPNAPKGLYKIGYDPVRQSGGGTSLASIWVYKGVHKNSYTKDTLVAEYYGRTDDPDDINRVFEMLIELYNTEGMYENEVTHVKSYFLRRKKLNLLAAQPDQVISNVIKNSGVNRVYGCHMNDKLKDAGEKYIKAWLIQERDYDDKGNPITNIDMIYSIGLLEELIAYSRKGNYDRVMALMQVMIQIQEEELGKEYGDGQESKPVIKAFARLINDMYSRN